jgi:hypothetical protein
MHMVIVPPHAQNNRYPPHLLIDVQQIMHMVRRSMDKIKFANRQSPCFCPIFSGVRVDAVIEIVGVGVEGVAELEFDIM